MPKGVQHLEDWSSSYDTVIVRKLLLYPKRRCDLFPFLFSLFLPAPKYTKFIKTSQIGMQVILTTITATPQHKLLSFLLESYGLSERNKTFYFFSLRNREHYWFFRKIKSLSLSLFLSLSLSHTHTRLGTNSHIQTWRK